MGELQSLRRRRASGRDAGGCRDRRAASTPRVRRASKTCFRSTAARRPRSSSSLFRRKCAHCAVGGSFRVARSARARGRASPVASASHRCWLTQKLNIMCRPCPAPKYGCVSCGSTFASPSSTASPTRHCSSSRNCSRYSKWICGLPLPRGGFSSTNGTASMRKPATPSCNQNPMMRRTSSRTRGLSMSRSGWKS